MNMKRKIIYRLCIYYSLRYVYVHVFSCYDIVWILLCIVFLFCFRILFSFHCSLRFYLMCVHFCIKPIAHSDQINFFCLKTVCLALKSIRWFHNEWDSRSALK